MNANGTSFRTKGGTLLIWRVPNRKSVGLYVMTPGTNEYRALAFFKSEELADEFCKVIGGECKCGPGIEHGTHCQIGITIRARPRGAHGFGGEAMSKYRKRPVVIEAIQFTGGDQSGDKVIAWAIEHGVGAGMKYIRDPHHTLGPEDTIDIPTREGTMTACPGDWIICGVKGEFYPCRADIFEQTYERVNDALANPEIVLALITRLRRPPFALPTRRSIRQRQRTNDD